MLVVAAASATAIATRRRLPVETRNDRIARDNFTSEHTARCYVRSGLPGQLVGNLCSSAAAWEREGTCAYRAAYTAAIPTIGALRCFPPIEP